MNIFDRVSRFFNPGDQHKRSVGMGSTGSSFYSSAGYGLTNPDTLGMFAMNAGPVSVNEESAISLATFYRCVDVLSSSFAALPGELLRTDSQPDGIVRTPAVGHPVRNLLLQPSDLQTPFVWKKTMFANAIINGNAYARIIRNGVNRPVLLKVYHFRQVVVTTDLWQNVVAYRFPDVAEPLGPSDVIHFKLFSTDGIMGRSIVRTAPDVFRGALQYRRFATKLIENGARPAAIIKHQKSLSEKAKNNIKSGWFDDNGGAENVGGTAVLDEGMEYQSIAINPVDAQLLEIMRLNDEQICTLTGVPQHMAGILTHSTNNNIEHQGIEFVVNSLTPHVVNFEQELDAKLLRTQEYGLYYHNFDLTELLRGDSAAQVAYYQGLRNAGIINANEVRNRINMNPYTGGEKYFVQGANLPLDENGLPMYPPAHVSTNPTEEPKKNGLPVNGHKLSTN